MRIWLLTTFLGTVGVATDRGQVVRLEIGTSQAEFEELLRKEFPQAQKTEKGMEKSVLSWLERYFSPFPSLMIL